MMVLRSFGITLVIVGLSLSAHAQNCDQGKPATTPTSRFESDGPTITDTHTGKIWLRCPVGMQWRGGSCAGSSLTYSFREALHVIDELNAKRVAGHKNWRLPRQDELEGIVEHRCFKPAINLDVFPYTPESGFWTATVSPGFNPRAMIVHFLHGRAYVANKRQSWRLRLVADK
jgi:hypothetical protein